MSTLQVNEAGEMTAEISQTVMTEAESEPIRSDNSKPTSDAVETNSTHSIPDDRAVEEAKERAQNILDESIEAEEKAVASSPDGRFLAFDIEIGRGSFKTVFKGLDTETGVSVAWCELQDKYSKTERSRFKEEAVMLKQLTHPNIVKFHEFFERPKTGQKDKKQLILVTELMTSGTLKTYLKRFKGVREKVLKSWCRQILEGLYFLHTRTPPIIHRDLKCDNIFVNGSTGLIKIGDLGLATLKKHSFAKSVIGTPEFMAPEMYEERYDESVDVYAFGMCMLEMVTLEYPYMECQNAAQIYKRVTQGIPPDCLAKVQNSDIYDIIQGCTKYKKEERYTIPYLLKCPFFKLGVGIKVDLVLPLEVHPNNPELVKLQLRLGDPKLRRDKHKDNEAIQFDFDLVKDNPEKISKELVSSGFIDENSMQLAAKTIKECVEAVKKQREKGGLEGKESEAVEKNHHSSESSHSVQTEEHGKSVTEEPSDPAHGRSAVASQSTKNQGQSFHQQPQSTMQVQSQQQQQQQQPQQQQPRTEPESQEVRSRQNSTNEELASQQAKATASSVASKDSGISNTSVVSSVVSDDAGAQRLEPLHVQTTSADTKPSPASPDPEKNLPTNTESSSTISEKASNETVGMSSSGNSSTISLPGSQPTSQTSTQQPAQQGQQVTQVPPGQSMGKTKKKERAFKLTLITVTGDEIECSFDTYKNYRITFKFDISEDESMDIAKMMIDAGHLRDANKGLFVERLRRILGDARSKKDADNGTVRYEHQTSLESNPGSAHTLPTPTEKNEAFQFPVSQPNVQSTPVQGTPVLQQGVATNEQDPVGQQPSTQVSQQPAKSQSTQQAVPAPETISQVTNPQQDQQQVAPQVTKAAQQENPQQNTPTTKPQAVQQVQQPTSQADQQNRQSVTNQATPQQVNQPVRQANQHTVPPANQQSIVPRASQQIVPKAEPQPPPQARTGTMTNQVNQQSIPNQANPTVNSPTSFPQPLTAQPQDTTTKSTTPTEVRTVVAKKKQFQVQVLQEPPNIPVTDLPIQPVNSNVPNNTPVNTNVAQGPSVNTGVPHDTKVSPVQEVAPSIVASQTTAQGTTTQQPGKSNAETSTENVSNEISSLPSKQPGAVAQGTDDIQNTMPNVGTTAQSLQTRTSSPVQQHQSQVIPKPDSPVIGRSDATQNTSLRTAGVQQATSTQTSLGQEANIESSCLTETRDTPQESIRVQSPISSHPPIYIPINPGETTKDKTIPCVDNEKPNKYDEIVALTSSIETQTSFDKNLVQEQAKKLTERKTVEKSSSEEHVPDESDGSSDKSISRQSSDNSYSAQDVDINAGPKNIGIPQDKVDIEQWINQICFIEGDGEGSNLSREDTDELKRLCKKQEKERDEMNKRQTKELNELYKKLEQRRNDKVPKDSKRPGGSTTKTPIAITQAVHEAKPSNGQNKTTLAKKQIHHSDENIKKLQQRSMQQFELDVSKKKGGTGTMAGVWSTNKQAFNQMKGPPVTTAMVLKGPRGVPPTSSSSMPHIPQSVAGYIPHSSSSMVFAPQQNNVAHSQVHTGVYWTNGANQSWPTNVETGNGRGQPVAYPDNTRHVTDMNSWQTNGPYHPVATQPPSISQGNNPPRADGQMPPDNSKHVVLPSR